MSENKKIPGRGAPPRTPSWVKVFVIVLIILAVIVVVAHLAGFRFDHGGEGTLLSSFASLIENTALQL